jgi:hypothetical protein
MRRLWLRFQSVTTIGSCADILLLPTKIRGGVNGLIAEILQDHIRLPMMNPDQEMESPEQFGEDLIGAGAGISDLTKHGTLSDSGWFCECFRAERKKDGPEPPKPSLENPPG